MSFLYVLQLEIHVDLVIDYAFYSAEPDADTEFFERFSSIRIQYETSERKTIEEFKFQPDAVDGQTPDDELLDSVGGWNVSQHIVLTSSLSC